MNMAIVSIKISQLWNKDTRENHGRRPRGDWEGDGPPKQLRRLLVLYIKEYTYLLSYVCSQFRAFQHLYSLIVVTFNVDQLCTVI